ncbi:MAG: adenine deaminase C-terminal domain-containing protein, partial [Anaerolineales bacterium]
AMLRFGSAWHDVAEQVRAVTEQKMDARHFILCTDDSHSETLVNHGHMDRVVRHAISMGVSPITAIQMATINTAQHFGVTRQVGMIAPGRYADVLLVRDLPSMQIEKVIAKGKIIAEHGRLSIDLPTYDYPTWVKSSVNLGKELTAQDFQLQPSSDNGNKKTIKANVIGIIENQAPTRHLQIEVPAQDGEIQLTGDLAKLALVERHKGTGNVVVALVHGFGLQSACAIGSTIAHDSHHMILVGTSDVDMAIAGNELAHMGGGQIVVKDGKVIGKVELPIAGLMSDEKAEIVAKKAATVLDGIKACGCQLNSPNMQLSLLALVVIPELRISDLGLVDVNRFEFIPIFEE